MPTSLLTQYLTVEAVAALVHVHIATVKRWLQLGYLVGYEDPSGDLLISRFELERAFEKQGPTRMRDNRRRYQAKVVRPLPITGTVVRGGAE